MRTVVYNGSGEESSAQEVPGRRGLALLRIGGTKAAMRRNATALFKAALSTLYYTGGHRMLAPLTQGAGAIFMLHQVTPDGPRPFDPNRILRVTPEFLAATIDQVRRSGYEIISLDEAHRRLAEGMLERRFVCFTFDDGYRDNWQHAYPIFRERNLPLAIYVPGSFPDGTGELWWLALERVIAEVDEMLLKMDGTVRRFPTRSARDKARAFHEVYWWLRRIDETEARRVVRELCRGIGYDAGEPGRSLMMNWDELRAIARDPLVTIGAHTNRHFALAKLSESQVRFEIEEGARRLEKELGVRPRHLSFPYGDAGSAGPREFRIARELGYQTAVTTQKGLLYAGHCQHLTQLPRLSLNGDYQEARYLAVLLSGAPFAIWNGFRRVRAA